jgi:hypothetical protein
VATAAAVSAWSHRAAAPGHELKHRPVRTGPVARSAAASSIRRQPPRRRSGGGAAPPPRVRQVAWASGRCASRSPARDDARLTRLRTSSSGAPGPRRPPRSRRSPGAPPRRGRVALPQAAGLGRVGRRSFRKGDRVAQPGRQGALRAMTVRASLGCGSTARLPGHHVADRAWGGPVACGERKRALVRGPGRRRAYLIARPRRAWRQVAAGRTIGPRLLLEQVAGPRRRRRRARGTSRGARRAPPIAGSWYGRSARPPPTTCGRARRAHRWRSHRPGREAARPRVSAPCRRRTAPTRKSSRDAAL